MAGLYLHVPFCAAKCVYCDFYSIGNKSLTDAYITAAVDEIKKVSKKYPDKIIDTVYFGGGTPSILSYCQLKTLTDAIYDSFNTDIKEFSMEVNPESADELELYKELGVSRISVGVQSSNDSILKSMGRRHTAQQALDILKKAREIGYSVSADVMLGFVDSNIDDVKKTIDDVAPWVDHVSCYMLKLEERTVLSKKIEQGKMFLPDDDSVADVYSDVVEILENYGLKQYEISNFSIPGHESLHNMKYWNLDEYIAIGPGAHGYVDNVRYYNVADIKEYIDGINSGNDKSISEKDDYINGIDEYVMLGLRLNRGISLSRAYERYGENVLEKYADTLAEMKNFFVIDGDNFRLKREYFLIQNAILRKLFNL